MGPSRPRFEDTVTGLKYVPDEEPSDSGEYDPHGSHWEQDKKYVLYVLKQLGKGLDANADAIREIQLKMASARGGVALLVKALGYIAPATVAYLLARHA